LNTAERNSAAARTALADELKNFQEIVKQILPLPGEIPTVDGMDIFGDTLPLNGYIGGDHIIYVDYKKRYDLDARIEEGLSAGRHDVVLNLERCRTRAGIALMDVSGHHVTDALLAAMLHQAFLLGSLYELDTFGHITKRLFENLNSRFYHSSSRRKFVTMIYGEIAKDSTFRFLSAAHPPPVVFSNKHERFMDVSPELCTSFPPIGILPSQAVIDRSRTQSILGFKDQYELNEWTLMGRGDILLLYTDGLLEHARGSELYFPHQLERTILAVKDSGAQEIFQTIKADLFSFAAPSDDVSIVVIKRT
jgi:serine phosphatase RsbU (regulator of sigma subunit)